MLIAVVDFLLAPHLLDVPVRMILSIEEAVSMLATENEQLISPYNISRGATHESVGSSVLEHDPDPRGWDGLHES